MVHAFSSVTPQTAFQNLLGSYLKIKTAGFPAPPVESVSKCGVQSHALCCVPTPPSQGAPPHHFHAVILCSDQPPSLCPFSQMQLCLIQTLPVLRLLAHIFFLLLHFINYTLYNSLHYSLLVDILK